MIAAQALIEYLKTQFSVKRRRDTAELYTRKYQDIIRNQVSDQQHIYPEQMQTNILRAPLATIIEESNEPEVDIEPQLSASSNMDFYKELSEFAANIAVK